MSKHAFEVTPVKRYDGAHYPSPHFEPCGEEAPEDEPQHCSPSRMAAIVVLALGLTLGLLVSCNGVERYPLDDPGPGTPNGPGGPDGPDGPDIIDGGVAIECTPGDVQCVDNGASVSFCDADGLEWTTTSCQDYCLETKGQDYWSAGCSAQAEDPCLCEYGIVEGEWIECNPGDLACNDDGSLLTCDDYYWAPQDCNAICKETYGIDSYSKGCDAEADEPCNCETDIIDGFVAQCTPGEVVCAEDHSYMVCEDDLATWTQKSCQDYCNDTGGEFAYATGCDATRPEQPCECEYDIIDGDIDSCTPGDIYCTGEKTAALCSEDTHWYEYVSCEEYCPETYGADYYSEGCDASSSENFCGCYYGIVDGEPVGP